MDWSRAARLEANRSSGRNVEAKATSGLPVERQHGIDLGEVEARADLNGMIPNVEDVKTEGGAVLVNGDGTVCESVLPGDHDNLPRIGS